MSRIPAAGDIWSLTDGTAERGMVLVGRVGATDAATVPVTANISLAGESSPIIPPGRSHTGQPLLVLSGRAKRYRLEDFGSCLIEAAVTPLQSRWMAVEESQSPVPAHSRR